MPCSRTQHGVASADRTQDLSIRSLMHYNYATAIPTHILKQVFGFNMMKQSASTLFWTFNRLWLMTLLKASIIFDYVKWIPFRSNQFSLNDIWLHTTITGSIRYSVEYEQYSNIHGTKLCRNCRFLLTVLRVVFLPKPTRTDGLEHVHAYQMAKSHCIHGTIH